MSTRTQAREGSGMRRSRAGGMVAVAFSVALLGPLAGGAAAVQQSGLIPRILEAGERPVRMEYAVREGVELCRRGGVRIHREGDRFAHRGRRSGEACGPGPAVVRLRLHGGALREVRVRGAAWAGAPDAGERTLGRVPAGEAARTLLALARRSPGSPAAEDALFGAVMADSATVWPTLLEMARDEELPRDLRKTALFWTSQIAAERAARGLEEVVRLEDADLEVREAAVFALSQLPHEAALEGLLEVARDAPHPGLTRKAFFWLAQIDDPRVTSYFEEVLVGAERR